jgi:hypothetical protein
MENIPDSTLALPFLSDASTTTIFLIAYGILCLCFIGHWLVASYHWYTFGSERRISLISAGVYGGGGFLLLAIMGGLLVSM